MTTTADSASMKECLENCLECHRVCFETAMNHCLETGGRHVEPEHFRLMINCADLCQAAARLMLSGSEHRHLACGPCAEICEACAESSASVGGMAPCVQACRTCAASCRKHAR